MRLQLRALAYNLANIPRTLALPEEITRRSLTSLCENVVRIGTKVIAHARYTIFQMTEVGVPRQMFQANLSLIARLRAPPAPA